MDTSNDNVVVLFLGLKYSLKFAFFGTFVNTSISVLGLHVPSDLVW
jgi:hypothetical protein